MCICLPANELLAKPVALFHGLHYGDVSHRCLLEGDGCLMIEEVSGN